MLVKISSVKKWSGIVTYGEVVGSPLLKEFKDVQVWHLGTWLNLAVLGKLLGSMFLEGFSSLKDSVIL